MTRCGRGVLPFLLLANLSFGQSPPRPFFSLEVTTKVDVLKFFPLNVGAQWVYENERKEAVGKDNVMLRAIWESVLTVVKQVKTSDGLLVKRSSSVRNVRYDLPATADQSSIAMFKMSVETPRVPDYFVRGNYVFEVYDTAAIENRNSSKASRNRDWDNQCPQFFFPMRIGLRWSEFARESVDFKQAQLFWQGKGDAPNPGMYYWVVTDRKDLELPAGKIQGVSELIYRTNGGPLVVWFKEGIGIVKSSFIHSGSPWEERSVLKQFVPAPGGSNDQK
jgi:hypothetical protein